MSNATPGTDGGSHGDWQIATVEAIATQTSLIKTFRMRLERAIGFMPGQHADVRLTAPDGYQAVRSYSITDLEQGGHDLEIAVERLPDGEVSPFLHDVVAVGDRIELRAPLGGHFVWPVDGAEPLLLVGAGSGVAPFVAMLRGRARQANAVPAVLLLSVRTYGDVPWRDELMAMGRAEGGPSLILTLTRERPARPADFRGRVDRRSVGAALDALPSGPKAIFVCGSNAFVNVAADALLGLGVPAASIKTERYGG